MLVDDHAAGIDDERLRHSIDAPLDGCAAIAVRADHRKGIAVAPQEAPCVRGKVLVIDATQRHALLGCHANE